MTCCIALAASALLVPAVAASPAAPSAVGVWATRTPNDPHWTEQAKYLETIRLPEAWGITTGSDDIVVAVVDSGVDLDHPDLADRLVPGFDAVDEDGDPQDEYGHGTMVAGIVAAASDNGLGVAGVLPSGKILPVRVLNRVGGGNNADIAQGIVWAADHGADVITLSITNYNRSSVIDAAVEHALSRDVVLVAAAGNHGDDRPTYPAVNPGVVAVAATDAAGDLASFSNYGDWIDLAAPGMGIVSTALSNDATPEFRVGEGTSMAAPLVAGVAALARAADPGASAATVATRLRAGARDRGPHGVDRYYGAGLLDALGALTAAPPTPSLDWVPDPHEPDGTPDRANGLAPGTATVATIAPEGDADWFVLDVSESSVLTFTVTPPSVVQGRAREMDPDVSAYDPGLRELGRTMRRSVGQSETLTVEAVQPGRYRLRVANDLTTQSPGQYTVDVHVVPRTPRFRYVKEGDGYGAPYGQAVALADVDGDGRAELLSSEGGDLRVQEPGFDGLPTDGGYVVSQGGGRSLAVGDLDGDGGLDVLAARGDGIMKIRQTSGRLVSPRRIGPPADQVVIADIDADGRQDVVYHGYALGWLRNSPSGWIDSPLQPKPPKSLAVGDVTGDGRPDLVGVFCSDPCWTADVSVRVLRAEPDGSFTPVDYAAGDATMGFGDAALAVADVTGDARNDVVLALGMHGHA